MRNAIIRIIGTTGCALLLASAGAQAQTSYTVMELGSFGGPFGRARGLNDLGQVSGSAYTSAGIPKAFRWTPGGIGGWPANPQMEMLPDLTGPGPDYKDLTGNGFGINNLGDVAGVDGKSMFIGYTWAHGTLWPGSGSVIDLGPKNQFTYSLRVNDAGQVVGFRRTPPTKTGKYFYNAVMWMNGVMVDLAMAPGFKYSHPWAINASGKVVGYLSNTYQSGIQGPYTGFVWTPVTPNAAQGSMAVISGFLPLDINDDDIIAGNRSVEITVDTFEGTYTFPVDRALLSAGGLSEDLPLPDGFLSSHANALNDLADPMVAGSITQYLYDGSSTTHAALWSGGTVVDLNDLIPSGSGWVLDEAVAVNDAGWIVCNGTKDGVLAGAVLVPAS